MYYLPTILWSGILSKNIGTWYLHTQQLLKSFVYLHMQVQDGPYSLTYGPFTHHHQHKKPLLHRACLCHRSQGFIYPSPGTQFSSSFTYLQGKNETFQGYGLVFSLIFKFLCRHNFMFIRNCKRFCTLSKTKFIKELNNLQYVGCRTLESSTYSLKVTAVFEYFSPKKNSFACTILL